ncbi:hypothetical protein MPSEU_000415700 [Mayamaea pseudoterrestris]|nr:hypothetical protein MPSEU_000415700 [Mayamaea pseudoterrestris]
MRRSSHLDIDDGSRITAPNPFPLSYSIPSPSSVRRQQQAIRSKSHLPPVLPGQTRRKRVTGGSSQRNAFWYRFYSRWCKRKGVSRNLGKHSRLLLAIVLWFSLGVVSIGSSKILLMKHDKNDHFGSVPPLFLTIQQLLIGSSLLRLLLQVRFLGSAGLQPWPGSRTAASYSPQSKQSFTQALEQFTPNPSLVYASIYFTFGFLATNYGFAGSSAAFVETIKASEPITSASVAVWFGIETLSKQEATSLLVIVLGVLLSTVGNYHASAAEPMSEQLAAADHVQSTLFSSVLSSLVVMASNLCFSFRGLHQKLFRATPEGSVAMVDDLNLQFRMQQLGVVVLAVPVLLWDMPGILRSLWTIVRHVGILRSGLLYRYATLALLNGCAFTCYNLASTYILTRISVVHHAALNCIRRIFAIIVTSIYFGIPITFTGVVGIVCSFAGFMAFSHSKAKRILKPKQLSSLLPVSAKHANSLETP